MEGLLDLARREDARILFSGDTRQIQSVESSDALRILERESRMTSVSLTGIQRQSKPEYREAIETFRKSPDQGFAKLQDLGFVREVPYMERAQAVAAVYREMTAEPGRKVLVVAPTHEEIGRVTQAIREDLKQRSVLGVGETLQRHIPLQWTEAQKKDISNCQPEQVLVFHRASHGIEKHEALTILMMANRKEPGFRATNGELTTVRSVERGIINLDDGRSVPANYREFTHGYAVTARIAVKARPSTRSSSRQMR
jgi:ATP-dependent exoDNAse (exonuclease V) alpha subunit